MPYVTVCWSTNFLLGKAIHNRNHKCYQLLSFLELQIFLEYIEICDRSADLVNRERRFSHSFSAPAGSFGTQLVETPFFNCSAFEPFKLHKKINRL